jgi:hypothetical protein
MPDEPEDPLEGLFKWNLRAEALDEVIGEYSWYLLLEEGVRVWLSPTERKFEDVSLVFSISLCLLFNRA